MQITIEWLHEQNACRAGIDWWQAQTETDGAAVVRKLSVDRWDWANWLLVRLMTRKEYLNYAIFAAEQVIDIYEQQHPADGRPRYAIEAAKAVLANDNPLTRAAARAAWAAAGTAGDAAWAAAGAAVDAAGDAAWAAWAAAGAAGDAAGAAGAAAWAAGAAAGAEMRQKILAYGLSLIDAEKEKPK